MNTINNYAELQAFITTIMEENQKPGMSVPKSPHKAFWATLSYEDFVNGNVPGVKDPATGNEIPILKKGDASGSNLIMALKGDGPLFDPEKGAFGQMPGGAFTKFTKEQIQAIATWIDNGCPQF